MARQSNNFIILIYGPTGVGKTEFVDELSQEIPSEIVNLDMGQFYTPLSIGTAKPEWKVASIPHHLFDIINEPQQFTVTAYRDLVQKTIRDIWKKNKIPILVGGSGFYLRSLFFPPQEAGAIVELENESLDSENLWEQLNEVDPDRARKIAKQDLYRIKRALALFKATGKKPSELIPVYDPPARFLLLCILRDRKQLYQRIDARVVTMLESGWIEEVRALLDTPWEQFILEKKIIGYDTIIHYLRNTISYDTLIAIIQKRTRNYAKRQIIFWRMLKRQLEMALAHNIVSQPSYIKEVNLTSMDLHLYIRQLKKSITLMSINE